MTEGFGEESYKKIMDSVERSRNTTFTRYVVAMDIPMIERTAGRILKQHFQGDLQEFAKAEAFLLANGFTNEDLEFLYFGEVVNDGLQVDCR